MGNISDTKLHQGTSLSAPLECVYNCTAMKNKGLNTLEDLIRKFTIFLNEVILIKKYIDGPYGYILMNSCLRVA